MEHSFALNQHKLMDYHTFSNCDLIRLKTLTFYSVCNHGTLSIVMSLCQAKCCCYPGDSRRRQTKHTFVFSLLYQCSKGVYVCEYRKTQLFTALLLEDCHEIALNSLTPVEYLFFE